jgi:glycosyltransferase involved in cell wall biosynthesis
MKPEPLHVVMLIQDYHPRLGGAQRQIAEQAPLLKDLGVEISVLTRRYPGLQAFERINGVPVHRLPIPGPKALAAVTFILSAVWKIIRLRPNLIHAQELLSPASAAVLARWLTGIPVVAKVLRGGHLGDMAKISRGKFGKWRVPLICNNIDGYAVISREIDTELHAANVPVSRRFRIPNGVDIERFKPAPAADISALRQSLGLNPQDLLALYAGRLETEKRVDQIIECWKQIRQNHPQARLLVLGSGSQEKVLRQIAGEGVDFIGQVDNVIPYLQAADLFILPSSTEGLSNAMLEALSCGLPVIATSVGGAEDVIQHGQNGWLIAPDQPKELCQAILTLFAAPELRKTLGVNARQGIVEHYALPVVVQNIRAMYDEVLKRQNAPHP